jgi:predicted deacylase
MPARLFLALLFWVAFAPPLSAQQANAPTNSPEVVAPATKTAPEPQEAPPRAASIDLKDVFESPSTSAVLPRISPGEKAINKEAASVARREAQWEPVKFLLNSDEILRHPNTTRRLLDVEIPPATSTRLIWKPSRTFSGMAVDTPVLVVNGVYDGPTMCITAAVHGDELNGIEMIRQVMYDLDPHKLHGMIIGVPIVNLLGFSRNSRYLPDRRDLNRYFPGNPNGSVASRIADAFFEEVVKHCNMLVDLHTGSFYRTNIPQLRADLSNKQVADFVELFGDIPVLSSPGNKRSLRAAAVSAGIPAVTLEAGEPMRMQRDMVDVGVKMINTLLAKSGMYSKLGLWVKPAPAFYSTRWVRTNVSGILFSRMELGEEVKVGDILGAVNNPISNEQVDIISPYEGRILGMALDQFVMPGFAVYHIGMHAAKEALMATQAEEDEDIDGEGVEDSADAAQMEKGPTGQPLDEDSYDDE